MSRVVDFRDRVIEKIKDAIPELREVDWYDGVFDQKDIAEWALKTPCAMVAMMSNANGVHHTTGELNLDLRCLVVIIDNDTGGPRDADARVWDFGERTVKLANLNVFGDPNAGAATQLKLKRLIHPDLRHEGVAVAVVEWCTGLLIGTNKSEMHEFIYGPSGARIEDLPAALWLGNGEVHNAAGQNGTDSLVLTTGEED